MLSDDRLQSIGRYRERLRSVIERGFQPLPTRLPVDNDYLKYGAHVDGCTCRTVKCERCGKQYDLNSFIWQLRHKEVCK